MKKNIRNLVLAISFFASTSLLSSEAEEQAVIEKYRVEYQDPEKLKKRLLGMNSSFEGFEKSEIERFKHRFEISDEIMRSVAMNIYNESIIAVKEKRTDGIDGGLNAYRQQVGLALFCLGLSADQSTKQMLMAIVTDSATESSFRRQAISSYLLAADPEEAKNALLRFLVEEDRMSHMERLSLYEYARMAYDSASPENKAAILAALIAAANKEEGKIEFMKVDNILAERCAAYRHSRERLAMLERHSLEPPTNNLYTDRDLKAALEECRNYKSHTSISTNLTTLKSCDLKMLQSELLNTNLAGAVQEGADKGAQSPNAAKRGFGVIIISGAAAILLLGFGIWKFSRK
jgi:hypothetical protein